MASIIQTNRLTKSYGRSWGIIDVTFAIEEGEVFGFLGPNGAGKTTTMRILMGLLHADSGRVTIGGLDCWTQSPAVKRLVGYLPGEFAFDPGLRGAQIIEYLSHLRGGVDQAYLRTLVERLGLHTLRRDSWSVFWWGIGVVFTCVYCLVLAVSTQQEFYKLIQETPLLQALFFDTPTNTNAAMLGTFLFTFMPAIAVVFALTLALKWSADLENGRLEVLLSTPQSRLKVLLSRFGVNALAILVAPLLTWLAVLIGAQLSHLAVDQGRVFAASFNMFPMALIVVSLVYALAGRLRYPALVSLLSAYIVLSYMEELFEGAISMPVWLMDLSIFHVYGNPVFLGINWTNFLGMTAVALLLLLIGLFQFRRADIKPG